MDAQQVRTELETACLRARKQCAVAKDLKAASASLLGDLHDLRAITSDTLTVIRLALVAAPNKRPQDRFGLP